MSGYRAKASLCSFLRLRHPPEAESFVEGEKKHPKAYTVRASGQAKRLSLKGKAKNLYRRQKMAKNEKIRIRLKAYDHTIIDQSAEKIVETAKRQGSKVSGPIPLPTEKEIVTILRAVHKYKDSREQFELRTHKRLIDVLNPSKATVDALMSIELPAGVELEYRFE